jgi:Flp pilus assembly protein TadD
MNDDKTINAKHASSADLRENLTENPKSDNRWEEAITRLEKELENDPCNAQDVVDLACAYQQAGRNVRAIELFEHVLSADGLNSHDRAALQERLGYCRLAMDQYEQSERIFEETISLDERSYRAHVGLGLCMARRGRKEEARACFEKP